MGKRILVVDDSSMMRKMLSATLDPAGHAIVGEAKSGEEAVEMYKDLQPDLVTMDITMKGMDGVTAAKEIMAHDPKAQVIFLSNLNEEKFKAEVEQLGAVGFAKKNKREEILALINELGS